MCIGYTYAAVAVETSQSERPAPQQNDRVSLWWDRSLHLASFRPPLSPPFPVWSLFSKDKPLRSFGPGDLSHEYPSPLVRIRPCHPHRQVKKANNNSSIFLGPVVTPRSYASSTCSQSSSSLPDWTCPTRHSKIRHALHSSPYLPTSLCPSIILNPNHLSTRDTEGTSSLRWFSRPQVPGTALSLRSYASRVNFLRFLHFFDLVLGFQVSFTSKFSNSRTLEPFGCHGQQVGSHQCFGAPAASRDRSLRLEFLTLV